MYTEIWHTCFFYLTKRFYEKILFEPDHIARKLFCNEHVKIKIFISKKEILSIQNDGYLMDKMAKNVIMNKDCTLWRNDVSEKNRKVFQALTLILQFGLNMIVPIVMCTLFGTWIGRKYDMLWIVIPLFIMGALAGFTNIFKMAKRFTDRTVAEKMLRRINDALPGLVLGIIVYGVIVELAGVWFVTDKVRYTTGLLIGISLACGMAVNIATVLRDAVELYGEDNAKKKIVAKSLLRYAVVVIVFFVMMKWNLGNLITAFIGVLGLKVSAYLQPFTHRVIQNCKEEVMYLQTVKIIISYEGGERVNHAILMSSGAENIDFMIHGIVQYEIFGHKVWITTSHVCILIVMLLMMALAIAGNRAIKHAKEIPGGFRMLSS